MAHSSVPLQLKIAENQAKVVQLDFAYTFRPIYYFSRIFGFLPFTIVYNSIGSIQAPKIRVFDMVWFFISIFFYALSIFIIYLRRIKFPKNASFILINGDFLLLISGLIFSILVVVMDMCNRYKLVDILRNFNSFDEKASQQQFNTFIKMISKVIKSIFPLLNDVDGRCGNSFRI